MGLIFSNTSNQKSKSPNTTQKLRLVCVKPGWPGSRFRGAQPRPFPSSAASRLRCIQLTFSKHRPLQVLLMSASKPRPPRCPRAPGLPPQRPPGLGHSLLLPQSYPCHRDTVFNTDCTFLPLSVCSCSCARCLLRQYPTHPARPS